MGTLLKTAGQWGQALQRGDTMNGKQLNATHQAGLLERVLDAYTEAMVTMGADARDAAWRRYEQIRGMAIAADVDAKALEAGERAREAAAEESCPFDLHR